MNTNISLGSGWIKELIKQVFSLLKTLSKETVKTIVLVLVLMIFWFLSIYFIAPTFYKIHPYWITVLTCFALSLIWLLANVFLVASCIVTFSPLISFMNNVTTTDEEFIVFGGINSLIYLTIMFFVSVYIHISYRHFILLCFSYIVFALTYIGITFLLINKSKK